MVAPSGGRSTGVRPERIRVRPSGAPCVDPRRPRPANQRFCAPEHQNGAPPRDARSSRPVSLLPRRSVSVHRALYAGLCLETAVRSTAPPPGSGCSLVKYHDELRQADFAIHRWQVSDQHKTYASPDPRSCCCIPRASQTVVWWRSFPFSSRMRRTTRKSDGWGPWLGPDAVRGNCGRQSNVPAEGLTQRFGRGFTNQVYAPHDATLVEGALNDHQNRRSYQPGWA